MTNFIIGFLAGSIGLYIISSINILIDALTELIKAKISVSIVHYNKQINDIHEDMD